ncbi:hypothetical protein BUALT_Bualt18G0053300 [Buddleja alternifolia]|uniref:Nuclear/nucleolar GTPase 2 n=1 Tax=Buddleja alternifolia TaxID=168488 RepID=A0AAV6W3M6_9LAMI|nr:hypothetical protein BUALT_Bualt18G0053300 [Buddleja alternifolia]
MDGGEREVGERFGEAKHSLDVNRNGGKSKSNNGREQSTATMQRLKMYITHPTQMRSGSCYKLFVGSGILKHDLQSKDRRWFGNTHGVNQKELEFCREELSTRLSSNYNVILKDRKLPMSLLNDHQKQARVHLLDTEPFSDAFGPKTKRKGPKLIASDYESFLKRADGSQDAFEEKHDAGTSAEGGEDGFRDLVLHTMFEKGQSKRTCGELYKVIDSSDVVVQVGKQIILAVSLLLFVHPQSIVTCKHKHMIFLLNKCDLVPAWATKGWIRTLSREYPTLAFHASINKSFGKGVIMLLLRQFARLKSDKQTISVGFVGYPSVGKSSVINTLRTKNVMLLLSLIYGFGLVVLLLLELKSDTLYAPNVCKQNSDTETDIVLKGVVRVTNLADASEHIGEFLKRVQKEHLQRAYKISNWEDDNDFLLQLCRSSGKGSEGKKVNLTQGVYMILHDWQRGKIPFFVPPPKQEDETEQSNEIEAEKDEVVDGDDDEKSFQRGRVDRWSISCKIDGQKKLEVQFQINIKSETLLARVPDKINNEIW